MQLAHFPSNNCSYNSTVSSLSKLRKSSDRDPCYWSIENFSAGTLMIIINPLSVENYDFDRMDLEATKFIDR